jgi:seryl-tRNA synthetase
MLDIKRLRDQTEAVRQGLKARNANMTLLDQALELDRKRRAQLTEVETLKSQRNRESKTIGELRKKGEDTAAAQAAVRTLGDRIAALDQETRDVDLALDQVLLSIPNVPHPAFPCSSAPARGCSAP